MGGGDKTALDVGGLSLLDRALEAAAGAEQTIVVGAARPTRRDVRWTREEPPGGGPAAALASGLRLVSAPFVLALAGDLPFVTGETVVRLLAAAQPSGAVMVDDDRPRPMAAQLLADGVAARGAGRAIRRAARCTVSWSR